ncbi:Uncharacterised protein [Chlamydia trachomatis]|nr:Uncharacterised protein [Chlamydia trachomatis]
MSRSGNAREQQKQHPHHRQMSECSEQPDGQLPEPDRELKPLTGRKQPGRLKNAGLRLRGSEFDATQMRYLSAQQTRAVRKQ